MRGTILEIHAREVRLELDEAFQGVADLHVTMPSGHDEPLRGGDRAVFWPLWDRGSRPIEHRSLGSHLAELLLRAQDLSADQSRAIDREIAARNANTHAQADYEAKIVVMSLRRQARLD